MKSFKKQFVLIGICVVIGLAIYINWRISQPDNADEAMEQMQSSSEASQSEDDDKILGEAEFVSSNSEYFDAARLNRQTTRQEAMRILEELIANENITEEERASAQEKLAALSTAADAEGRIENLIMAKGFEECVAIIGEDTINIVVLTDGLQTEEVVAIKDIAVSETAFAPECVKIIETK